MVRMTRWQSTGTCPLECGYAPCQPALAAPSASWGRAKRAGLHAAKRDAGAPTGGVERPRVWRQNRLQHV